MKKIVTLICIVAYMSMALIGCTSSPAVSAITESTASVEASLAEESPAPATDPYKIGILAPAATHGWVATVAYRAEERCKELGPSVVEYQVATSTNVEEMTAQLDDLKAWGAQAIVTFPQWEGMEAPIQTAIDEGVFVVNFDITIQADGVYRVSGDNEDMGVQGANYIVDKIGTEGKVVVLTAPTAGSISELREKGFVDTMKVIAPEIELVTYTTQFTQEAGQEDMTDILADNPEIDAVYSMDDEDSIGVLKAIDQAGRTDIKVVTGGGGCQEYFKLMPTYENLWVQSALYSPTVVKDAVDMAVAILRGETVEEVKIVPTTIVDKSNYKEFLDENTPY